MQVRDNKLYEFIVNCFVYYTGNVNSSVQYVKWETDARTATWCKQRVYILVSFSPFTEIICTFLLFEFNIPCISFRLLMTGCVFNADN